MSAFTLIDTDDGVDLKFNLGNKVCSITNGEIGLVIECGNYKEGFRYYSFAKMLKAAIQSCLKDYVPFREGKFKKIPEKHWENFSTHTYPKKMAARQQKLLSKAFKPLWENLLKKANQDLVALDKALQHARGPKADIKDLTSLYQKIKNDKWAMQDCIKYVPALLYYLNTNKDINDFEFVDGSLNYPTISNNWRNYYADNRTPTKALNQTLDAIKYPLAFDFLNGLKDIPVEKPLLEKIQLTSLLHTQHYIAVRPFIFKSNAKELRVSLKKVAEIQGNRLDLRKTRHINFFYLNDYLRHEPYNGTLIGLVNRAKEWHDRLARDLEAATRIRTTQLTKEQSERMLKENKKPAFELSLLDERVKFLVTVKDLYDESDKMLHCVRGYSDYTTVGKSYIFHVDYQDEMATIELNANYGIVQCQGIKNKKNSATKWAESYFKQFLTKWRNENGKTNN